MLRRIFPAAVVLLVFFTNGGWGQVYSTLQGGPWSAPSTWQSGVVPSASDDVVLMGSVQLDVGGNYYVHSLTVETGAQLTLVTTLPSTYMNVTQDVVNRGHIEGQSSLTPLYFNIGGGLINYGTWQTYTVAFPDTMTHLLRAEPGSYFAPTMLAADNAKIVSDRDAYFYGVEIHIDTLKLQVDHVTQQPTTFYFLNGSLLRVNTIEAQENAIAGDASSYIGTGLQAPIPDFQDIHIKGETILNTHLHVTRNITIDDTLRLMDNSTTYRVITVLGDLINNGALIPNNLGYGLNWECAGSVHNAGEWNDHSLTLTGSGLRTLYTDLNFLFFPRYFDALQVTILSDSSLRFDDTRVKIRKLILQPGHDLYLQLNTTFYVDTLVGNHNRLHCNDYSELGNAVSGSFAPVYHNIILTGTARLNTNLEVQGSMVIEGILKIKDNYTNNRQITVYGDLENRGEVALNNNGYGLMIALDGNLVNSGDWETAILDFFGNPLHHLFTDPLHLFHPGWVYGGNVTIVSDTTLRFDDGTIKIKKLILQPEHNLILNQQTQFQVDTLVGNDNTLYCNDSAQLQQTASGSGSPLYYNIRLAGTVRIGSSLIFKSSVMITDSAILKLKDGNYNYGITVNGEIFNYGEIAANSTGNLLSFIVTGNLFNIGVWHSLPVELMGHQTQLINIPDSTDFQAELKIYAMHSGNQYQWLRNNIPLSNGGNISGSTSNVLTLHSVNASEYGTYKCQIDSAGYTVFSREVVVDMSFNGMDEKLTKWEIPEKFWIYQNYPNPFNPVTHIRYDLPRRTKVQLAVYDALGRQIQVLVNRVQNPGRYTIPFNASHLASGVYVVRMMAEGRQFVRKMVLLK